MRLFLLPFLKLHATYSPVRFFSGSELFLHLFLCWRREMTASIFDTCVREGEWQPLQSSLLCWEVKVTTSCVGEEKRQPLYSTPMRGSDYLYGHHFLVDKGSASLFFATPVWESGEWQPLNKAQNAPAHIPVRSQYMTINDDGSTFHHSSFTQSSAASRLTLSTHMKPYCM